MQEIIKLKLWDNKTISLEVGWSFHSGNRASAYCAVFDTELGIYGFGKDKAEAMKDFKSSAVEFIEGIIKCPESELGKSTLKFKEKLLRKIES